MSGIEDKLRALVKDRTSTVEAWDNGLDLVDLVRAAADLALEAAADVADVYPEIGSTTDDRVSYERPRSVRANIAIDIRALRTARSAAKEGS